MVSIPINNDLLLRSYVPEDATALFHAIHKSRKHLRPWLNWVDTTTKEEHSLEFIRSSLAAQHNQEAIALGIFLNGQIIGGIGMHHWDHYLRIVHIGYWINKEHEGQGIISSSCRHFFSFVFEKLNINKIELHFLPGNKRSAAVAERLGCKIEGVIRQSIMINGTLQDVVIAGLLKSEWNK